MRILIVGDFSSIHLYNYVKNVVANVKCECVGYHIVADEIPSCYKECYEKNNVQIIQGVNPKVYRDQGAWNFTKQTCQVLNNLGKFDIMHLHAVRLFICPALFISRHLFNKVILTYWGSDLYRSTKLQLLKTLPLLHIADIITMVSDDMRNYFEKQPWYLSRYSYKIQVFDFGNMFYEKIKYYSNLKTTSRTALGFVQSKIICTIGYVGRPQMQQLKTIKCILSFLEEFKERVQLAIPAYGITSEDKTEIVEILENSGVDYLVFQDFMDADTVSMFRAVSDIFIHAQTSDALSCAMLEHLYAGSVVINGEWLKYSSLDDNNIYYLTFDQFSNLPNILKKVVENIDEEKLRATANQDRVAKISSWEYLKKYWLDLYSK